MHAYLGYQNNTTRSCLKIEKYLKDSNNQFTLDSIHFPNDDNNWHRFHYEPAFEAKQKFKWTLSATALFEKYKSDETKPDLWISRFTETFNEKFPEYKNSVSKDAILEMISSWHPQKNANNWLDGLSNISSLEEKFWWHFKTEGIDFEWEENIRDLLSRKPRYQASRKTRCPYFYKDSRAWLMKGFNDLQTLRPELAKEWHPYKNKDLTPDMVTPWDNKKEIYWLTPYYDLWTKKNFEFTWHSTAEYRRFNNKCPYVCKYATLYVGLNDFRTQCPSMMKYWNQEKNGDLKPEMITPEYDKKVWWHYPYDDPETGKHWDFEWQMRISTMLARSEKCPFFSRDPHWVWPGFNDLATCYPHLLTEWDYESNGDPSTYSKHRTECISWICSKCGHKYYMYIYTRKNITSEGCEFCSKQQNPLQGTSFPEQAIYHYVKKYFKDAVNRSYYYGFELDIYVPSLKTGIEYDGTYYHQDIDRDIQKNDNCQRNGVKLIRIREKGCPQLNNKNAIIINRKENIGNDSLRDVIMNVLKIMGVSVDLDQIDVNSFKTKYENYKTKLLSA